MTPAKPPRPAFQALELEGIDTRLEAKAAEKGIPTLLAPKLEAGHSEVQASKPPEAQNALPDQPTPRARMKGLKVELPDYVWVAIKKRAAEEMVSLRHVVMTALRAQGIVIADADMIEDGRRLRS
jgi:hypothetical protein